MKKISAKQFRELGFLQELNRQFLHTMGLALETVEHEDGSETFGGVWDFTDDPEGIIFDDSMISKDKIKYVKEAQDKMHKSRMETIGYIIQEPK